MSSPTILVVEDEPSFVDALEIGLGREGFNVVSVTDGGLAMERFRDTLADLVILDVMLPGVSGIELCRQIRAESSVPIIMVTAKASEIDTVVGLEVGADDYVAKPYRMRELVARVRAQLRRRQVDAADATDPSGITNPEVLAESGVVLDIGQHQVTVDGTQVTLPLKEFQLLRLLLANAGRVLTRDMLIERVWGADYFGDTKTLDVHIKRLRTKLEPEPSRPERIVTVRGVGYKFERS